MKSIKKLLFAAIAVVSPILMAMQVSADSTLAVNTSDKTKMIIYILIGVGAIALLAVVILFNKKDKK